MPADATVACAFYNYWEPSGGGGTAPAFTINGVSLTSAIHIANTGNEPAAGISCLIGPATGSQTLAWNWSLSSGTYDAGGGIYIVYVKGVDTGDLIRDADAANGDNEGSVSLTIDSNTTDLVLAMAASFNEAPEITGAATSLVNNGTINSHQTDIDVMTAGASTTSVVVTGLEYSGSAAISLKNDDGGGPGGSVAPLAYQYYQQGK